MWPAHSLQFRMITACPFQTGAGSKPHSLEAGQAEARSFDPKPPLPMLYCEGLEGSPFPQPPSPSQRSQMGPSPRPARRGSGRRISQLPIPPPATTLDRSPHALCFSASAQHRALERSSGRKGRSVQTGLVSQACRVYAVPGSSRSPRQTLHLWDSGLSPAHRGSVGLTGTPTALNKEPTEGRAVEMPPQPEFVEGRASQA